MTHPQQIVAAFDFDGTLTYSDTLIPFLRYTFGSPKTAAYLIPLLPQLTLTLFRLRSRQYAKELILTQFLKGLPLSEIEQMGKAFASHQLMNLIRPQGWERFQWHKNQGHTCILISANMSFFLSPFGASEGFDAVIASQAETDSIGQITGKLIGLNCYGQEKVRRLEQFLGKRSDYVLYAYGDSKGDKELLAFADHPFYRTFIPK
jgi:phosphatidylglycerophosphatase C